MDRNAMATSILLFLIVTDVSNASSSSSLKLRYLANESPSKNDTVSTSTTPPSSPLPILISASGKKKLNPKLDPNSSNKTDFVMPLLGDKKDPKPLGKPKKVSASPQKEKVSGNNPSLTSNPKSDKTMKENKEKKNNVGGGNNLNSTNTVKRGYTNKDKEKKKTTKSNVIGNDSKSEIDDTCAGIASRCEDQNSLIACVKGFGTGSKEGVVLVHNKGEKTLDVNLMGPFGVSFPKRLRVPKHGIEKLNISLTISEPIALVLTAGNGDCFLPLNAQASETYFFSKLPSYDKLLTPINGAYFLIVAFIIFGGSLACCMFRKSRRHDSGIPYQELEMGLPESMATTNVETAEGWDQVWDDDWDEDMAVRSPLGRNVANISTNGLTVRSSNKDGWENDWDD
ncbi:hypothetical protein Gotri_013846 [Gossypium trilobum]|uniref:DUF7356 domain-containing protein n=1 Tax=Gossypium trilobum TaxID=34281 RepID=A0A7J9DUS6_9ROSI|nr:hypothetical protein [Gossypium trilobum]